MLRHLNIRVHGRVQGVFFRFSAMREAEKLGIKGFARNDPDGTVYMEAEGEEAALESFLKWAGEGPRLASVEKVFSEEGKWHGFEEFKIEE